MAPSTVSKHLTILKTAGFVNDRREGKWVYYTQAADKGNPYTAGVRSLLKGRLDRDPSIRADRRRLREVLAVPTDELCGLPRVSNAANAAPRSGARSRKGIRA
jgi:arsenate reductase/ArsR family transcriptional regulator